MAARQGYDRARWKMTVPSSSGRSAGPLAHSGAWPCAARRPPGRNRASGIRRLGRALFDDLLRHLQAPRRRDRPARGGGRGRTLEPSRARGPRAAGKRRARPRGARRLRPELRAGSAARRAPAGSSACTRTQHSRSLSPATSWASGSWRRSSRSGPHNAARTRSSIETMPTVLETTRHEWQEGHRRIQAAAGDRARYQRLLEEVDVVLEELRRRVGGTFTLDGSPPPTRTPTAGHRKPWPSASPAPAGRLA